MRLLAWHPVVSEVSNWSFTDHRRPWGAVLLWATLIAMAVVLGRAPLTTAAIVVLGASVITLTLIRPAMGLSALALAIPIGAVQQVAIGPATLGITELLAMLTLVAWFARMAAMGKAFIRPSRLWILLGLMLATMLLSITQALSLSLALKELGKWLAFGAIMLCSASAAEGRERWLIILAMLLAGIFAGIQGWYQFLRGVGPETFLLFGRFMRAYGSFLQPNPYAGYLGMILALGLALVVSYWPWDRRYTDTGGKVVWTVALLAVAVIGPAILMSWSRGAWLGICSAIVAITLGRGRRFTVLILLAAIATGSAILIIGADRYFPASISERLTDYPRFLVLHDVSDIVPEPANWAVIERMAHWQAAARMFAEHPWLGIGTGNYEAVYPAYRLPRWPIAIGHAHNAYLNAAAETGLIGTSAFLLFWIGAVALAVRGPRQKAGLWRGVALGTLGAIAHVSIHNMFDYVFVQGIYFQIALLVGLTISLSETAEGENTHRI